MFNMNEINGETYFLTFRSFLESLKNDKMK